MQFKRSGSSVIPLINLYIKDISAVSRLVDKAGMLRKELICV